MGVPKMTQRDSLSVIMPLLNEEEILDAALSRLVASLNAVVGEGAWQLVPVDNGSTDRTPAILENLARRWPETRHLTLKEKNIGKAMKHGLLHADHRWAMILPIDEFDPTFLHWAWAHRNDYDLILGSKRVDRQLNRQTPYRRLLSWGLNTLLHLTVGNVTADTHGAKLVDMEKIRTLIEQTVIMRGQFDTELTLRCLRRGLRVAEIPVSYREQRPARNLMITKIGRNLVDLVRLNRVLRTVPVAAPMRYQRVSRAEIAAFLSQAPLPQDSEAL